ncbi:Glycine cleavage system H protein [Geodia barretti]|uniref:Glycine cleavage system H protein n=1 Tax=Geodia barretti TaxID=519541 RepID=A0AA35SZ13_GEOBA|nr:Glycine cleavage system H protein [Geodia barretti]
MPAHIWMTLVDEGAASCGLGARDVLRLEAGLLLHGNDMSVDTNPYEAGVGRFVRPDRRGYVAREALLRARDEGVERSLVGFVMTGRGIARHGYNIMSEGREIGEVTSGSPSPLLDRNIGLGYVPADYSAEETMTLDALKYSEEHEWVRLESDGIAVIGITDFAAESLGDVVFVELPEVGAELVQFEKMGEIESVKAVSDLYSPVSGTIAERNDSVIDSPELVNDSPFDSGWMLRVNLSDSAQLDNLMFRSEYQTMLEAQP